MYKNDNVLLSPSG